MSKKPDIDQLVVGGITPLTTIDYPGELAAVIFLQGCPWRCGYCQNSDLISRQNSDSIAWSEVIELLESRLGLLDAVVFSGGEPTLHFGLETAMQQVKSMGFKIGLHTAGVYPEHLKDILYLVDWVGFDIKSAQADYQAITGVKNSANRAWKGAKAVLDSGVDYEFRTTVHPDMLNRDQLSSLVDELSAIGAKHYVIQQCVTERCLDEQRRVVDATQIPDDFFLQFSDRFNRFSIRSL